MVLDLLSRVGRTANGTQSTDVQFRNKRFQLARHVQIQQARLKQRSQPVGFHGEHVSNGVRR